VAVSFCVAYVRFWLVSCARFWLYYRSTHKKSGALHKSRSTPLSLESGFRDWNLPFFKI